MKTFKKSEKNSSFVCVTFDMRKRFKVPKNVIFVCIFCQKWTILAFSNSVESELIVQACLKIAKNLIVFCNKKFGGEKQNLTRK